MPVYSMNFFKLPVTICDEIDSVLSKFWWGTTAEKRKMSWFSWKRLSHSKDKGGLGFRDLQDFNTALLGKQAWRIHNNPNSLLARTLKSRYHPNTNFLDANLGTQPSYGWSSLLHGKSFLKQGLCWQISEGKLNPWSHNWLPSDPPRTPVNITNAPYAHISDFWTNNEWDPTKILALSPEDQMLAKQIYIPRFKEADKHVWYYSKDGIYSVKSGYRFANSSRALNTQYPPPLGDHPLISQMWKSKIPPKHKHFLWKAFTSSLSTSANLASRGLQVNPFCKHCPSTLETANHLLFTCPYASEAWHLSQFPPFLLTPSTGSFEANMTTLLDFSKDHTLSPFQRQLPFSLLWSLWKTRNNFLFNNVSCTTTQVVYDSFFDADSWTSANTQPTPAPHQNSVSMSHWQPPPDSWVKCNYDACFKTPSSLTGSGWLVRDSDGNLLLANSSTLRSSNTALQAEGFSFLHAIQHMWSRGYRQVIMEGDSQVLVNLLTGKTRDAQMETLVSDIRLWLTKFAHAQVQFTSRRNNAPADHLAHQATLDDISCHFISTPSDVFVSLLHSDTL